MSKKLKISFFDLLNERSVISRCHKFTLRSSAERYVSLSELTLKSG